MGRFFRFFPLVARWKRDTALNSYILVLFIIGLPFTVFGTYVIYQVQVVGFIIGAQDDGTPCDKYCLVPFGSQKLDLNSVILYLNAMGFAFGGVLSLLLSAYADFWQNKGLLVTILIVFYGIVAIPVYWLNNYSVSHFDALMALYVVYAIITYLISALLNMYIPHYMRANQTDSVPSLPSEQQFINDEVKRPATDISPTTLTTSTDYEENKASTSRKSGFKMSILGGIATSIGGVVGLVLTTILSQALPDEQGQQAGLLVTTVLGFVTVVGSLVALFGLPTLPTKATAGLRGNWSAWWLQVLRPLRDLIQRRNMLVLLLAYTIYVDTVFALSSVTSQLYFVEIKPNTLEYSLYSLSGTLFSIGGTLAFFVFQRWRQPFRLELWLILGYAFILLIPIWGCIGLKDNINFGLKNRWEFYVQNLLFNFSGAVVNPTFRVLFSELVPKGSEIEWFGLQVVLSCATAWVSYITNAPLQNATRQLRFPMALCLIFLMVPMVLEILRCTLKVFKRDKLRWQEADCSESAMTPTRVGSDASLRS